MNFSNFFLKIIPFILILAFGCKEDVVVPTSAVLTLNGVSFVPENATIIGVSINNVGHAGISLVNINGTSVETLTIDVEYSGNSSIAGTYSFPQAASDKYLDNFLTNFTVFDGTTFSGEAQLTEGSISVQENGNNNYTINMNLIMDDGTAFKGTYTGNFTVVFNNG